MKKNGKLSVKWAVILFTMFTSYCRSQGDGSQFVQSHNYSPDAATGMSTNSADYYTGKLNISIPIHVYKGRELDLPISIDYRTDGVQVEELASSVGLGWNLNCGGRVNIAANKEIDSYPYLYNVPDTYILQVPGIKEYFKMEYHNPRALINPAIKAARRVTQAANWIVHMPDGSMYYFENAREVTTTNSAGSNTSFTSSWLLTKIVSKNKLDTYTFFYKNYEWDGNIPNNGEGYRSYSLGTHISNSSYNVTQMSLLSVFHNGEKIIGFNYEGREDLKFSSSTGNALSTIYFYNYRGGGTSQSNSIGDIYKKVTFNHSYFGNMNATGSLAHLFKRLKLDSVLVSGTKNNVDFIAGDEYSFEYDHPDLVPPITSFAQDYLGLYNGMDSNMSMVDFLPGVNPPGDTPYFRKSNFVKSQYGSLKKIVYPTKGYSEIEFEENKINGRFIHHFQEDSYRIDDVDVVKLPPPASSTDMWVCVNAAGHAEEFNRSDDMASISFQNFPGSGLNQHFNQGVFTTLLEVPAGGGEFYMDMGHGKAGLYLIQSLADLSCTTALSNAFCKLNYPGQYEYPTGNKCFYPLNSLVYTGAAPLPPGYYKGGIVAPHYQSNEPFTLPEGRYQVTLWQYSQVGETGSLAQLRIYKKVSTPVPAHFEDDVTDGDIVEGFRIKSVTNYSSNDKFASKKEYNYHNGQLIHQRNNYDVEKISSQGYMYADAVFYESVTERQVDLAGNYNGATEYVFANSDDPVYRSLYGTATQYGFENFYDPMNGSAYDIIMESMHNNDLKEKKVYDKNGYLLMSEKNHYGFGTYHANVWIMQGMSANLNDPQTESHFESVAQLYPNLQSTSITEYPSHGNGIQKIVIYEYDINDEEIFMPRGKYVSYNDRTDDYTTVWQPSVENLGSEWPDPVVTLVKSDNYSPNCRTSFGYGSDIHSLSLPTFIGKTYQNNAGSSTSFKYDTQKNLVEKIVITPGSLTASSYESYVYGYNNRYPVLKITGLHYEDIPIAIKDSIKNLTGNAINYSDLNSLITLFNTMRTNFPETSVTGYTYNPVYGLTSMTDEKGYTTYYEYDALGRLVLTKGKHFYETKCDLISENQYNTRPN